METKGLVSRHGDSWSNSLPEMMGIVERERPGDGETGPEGKSWAQQISRGRSSAGTVCVCWGAGREKHRGEHTVSWNFLSW